MPNITPDINYFSKQINTSILKYSECLEKYSQNFDKEVSLKTNSPIFLDTNVLLRYYSISFTAREKLYNFIEQNKNRIILSQQVQYEFLKNRGEVIQKFFEQVTNKIPKDFNSDIVNKMKSFLEIHKVVLKDYPFVENGIQKHQKELEEMLTKLNETSEEKRKEHIDLIVKDKFLNLLNSCVSIPGLENVEIDMLKKHFDILAKDATAENIDTLLSKTNLIFPGLGDIRNKPEDPYGDFIIYHEIMKYILTYKVDVIFLTFDNTKGDWMSKNKTPHLQYVQNMYLNTNQILYIIDAERTLGDLLNINIQSLVTVENNDGLSKEISIESLNEIIKTHSIFRQSRPARIPQSLIDELKTAGYESTTDIIRDLDRGIIAYHEYVKDRGSEFNYIGTYRVCLRIVNPNYKRRTYNGSSELQHSDEERSEKYKKYIIN